MGPGTFPAARVSMRHLQTLAKAGDLRFRVFGQETTFPEGFAHAGCDRAIEVLPELLSRGMMTLYHDGTGLFVGPVNRWYVDNSPLLQVEEQV